MLLGYADVQTFVARCMRGIPTQIKQWGRFIRRDKAGEMHLALQTEDLEAFVRMYNGSGNVSFYMSAIDNHRAEAERILG